VVPNGQPHAHSSFELVLEIIEGLEAAGVKTRDMFVYDRYRGEFMDAGYHKILPGDIRWGGLTTEGGDQFELDYPSFRNDPTAGYDPDTFVKMDLIPYGDDPKDERKYRSHPGKLVTKVVNKIVAIPVLKDHHAAGVTGALKNMSHGSVNNVARSHSNSFTAVCNQFIPQVVTNAIIREKFALHIMDGIRGVYHGGAVRLGKGRGQVDGSTMPRCWRPTPWHLTTSSGTSSTPSASWRRCPLSEDQASSRPIRWAMRVSTSVFRSTSPWRGFWAWATLQRRRHPAAEST